MFVNEQTVKQTVSYESIEHYLGKTKENIFVVDNLHT